MQETDNFIDSKHCRLCFSSENPEDMIAPCACDGQNKYVHRDCLNAYRIYSNDPANFGKCPLCGVDYSFKHVRAHSLSYLLFKFTSKLVFQITFTLSWMLLLSFIIGFIPYYLFTNYVDLNMPLKYDEGLLFIPFQLLFGIATIFFLVGIWSIINLLLKMCFGNAGEDVDLSARDVTRIGSCCSLCLCCMPYTWKKSFLANRGCCFLCKLLPNTLLTLVDCTSLCRCAFWYYCCCTPTRYYHRPYYMRPFVPVTPFIVYTPPGGCGCCRECANESCAGCCDCCTGIDCCVETNCCDGCGNGCGNCNCNGGGDAGLSILLMFLIGIVVIIIIFGFFVSVCAGIVMVTLLVKKNFDFVKKQANAETYIIDDWNENDHPMPTQNPPSISSNQNMDFYNEQMPLNPTVEYQENNFGNQYLQPPYEQNYQQNGVQQPPDMVIDMSAPPPNAQYVL